MTPQAEIRDNACKRGAVALRIIIEPTKSAREWIARLDDRILCVAASPFVMSACTLLVEGYNANFVVEMWRSNAAEWDRRGRLGLVAATVMDGETASRCAKNGPPIRENGAARYRTPSQRTSVSRSVS